MTDCPETLQVSFICCDCKDTVAEYAAVFCLIGTEPADPEEVKIYCKPCFVCTYACWQKHDVRYALSEVSRWYWNPTKCVLCDQNEGILVKVVSEEKPKKYKKIPICKLHTFKTCTRRCDGRKLYSTLWVTQPGRPHSSHKCKSVQSL